MLKLAQAITQNLTNKKRCYILTDRGGFLVKCVTPAYMFDYYELYEINNLKRFTCFSSVYGIVKFLNRISSVRGFR